MSNRGKVVDVLQGKDGAYTVHYYKNPYPNDPNCEDRWFINGKRIKLTKDRSFTDAPAFIRRSKFEHPDLPAGRYGVGVYWSHSKWCMFKCSSGIAAHFSSLAAALDWIRKEVLSYPRSKEQTRTLIKQHRDSALKIEAEARRVLAMNKQEQST